MSKRGAVAKQRIQQYYFQLLEGCGRSNCTNPDCASNPSFKRLSSNDAAAKAFNLFKNKATLCGKPPTKIPRTDSLKSNSVDNTTAHQDCNNHGGEPSSNSSRSLVLVKDVPDPAANIERPVTEVNHPNDSIKFADKSVNGSSYECDENINKKLKSISVTEPSCACIVEHPETTLPTCETIEHVLEELNKLEESQEPNGVLNNTKDVLWKVFSNPDYLNIFALSKEDRKSMQEYDEDKDVDETTNLSPSNEKSKLSMDNIDTDQEEDSVELAESSQISKSTTSEEKPIRPTVDINVVRLFHKQSAKFPPLERVILNAVSYLLNEVVRNFTVKRNAYKHDKNYLNMFVILMESNALQSPEALDQVFPGFCKVLSRLPIPAQAALARYWSRFSAKNLQNIVESLQQLITFKVVSEVDGDSDSNQAHNNEGITAASKCLNIFFYSSIMGGTMDRSIDESGAAASLKLRENLSKAELSFGLMDDPDDHAQFVWEDPLGKELNIKKLDSVKPLISLSEFINGPLNDVIKIDKDYTNYRISQQNPSRFSFLHHPFLLTTVSKTTHLFYDNRVTMYSERRRTLVSSIMQGALLNPYLKIEVRRSHIIQDALVQLELATEHAKDLKKQLYVKFDGEEGVDEGGVSKEFFQLVIDEIFNPENGVFVYNKDTKLFWFNPYSFEGLTQYKLIGIVLGLAIYNNCILDINFPSFIYKKLLGKKAGFHDMASFDPVLYQSLQHLLQYDGNVEEDILVTFCAEYSDVFGHLHAHDLKENGESIAVTSENRQEYVDLFAHWLLNDAISEQFNAFLSGFDLVVNDSPLKYLFYPDELELLIRGSEHYDFEELQRTTEYDGYSASSQTIMDFWSVVHEMEEEETRSLLQFSTGSDRAPVGGLAKLKMIIARHGPDSDRLPSAHTCFNVILLPDYKNKEKLKERLLKAIKYSKGFGML